MYSLVELKVLRELIAEREAVDVEYRWLWQIRKKVLNWSIAALERQAGATPNHAATDSTEARAALLTHHLLRRPQTVSLPAHQPDAEWRWRIRQRVQRFIDSCKPPN